MNAQQLQRADRIVMAPPIPGLCLAFGCHNQVPQIPGHPGHFRMLCFWCERENLMASVRQLLKVS